MDFSISCHPYFSSTIITLTILVGIFNFFTITSLTFRFNKHKTATIIKKGVTISCFTAVISFFFTNIGNILMIIGTQDCNINRKQGDTSSTQILFLIGAIISATFYMPSFIALYSLFAIKLVAVFDGTMVKVSKKLIKSFKFFVVTQVILLILSMIGFYAFNWIVGVAFFILGVLIYIIGSIILCIKFVSKFKAFTRSMIICKLKMENVGNCNISCDNRTDLKPSTSGITTSNINGTVSNLKQSTMTMTSQNSNSTPRTSSTLTIKTAQNITDEISQMSQISMNNYNNYSNITPNTTVCTATTAVPVDFTTTTTNMFEEKMSNTVNNAKNSANSASPVYEASGSDIKRVGTGAVSTVAWDDLSADERVLIDIMTQHTVLVCLALITSFVTIVILSIPVRNVYFTSIVYLVLITDVTMNMICISLQWPFNLKIYKRVCFRCDSCVKRLLTRQIVNP